MLKKALCVMTVLTMCMCLTACSKTVDYSKVQYTEVKNEVTDEYVNEQLEAMVGYYYKEIETDKIVVEDGDIITIKLSAMSNGEELPVDTPEMTVNTGDKDGYLDEFLNNCIGSELNVEKTFDVTVPNSDNTDTENADENTNNSVITYTITVTGIKEAGKFEIDDELAQYCGFDTLDELKIAIKVDAEASMKAENEFLTQVNVLNAYAEIAGLEVKEEDITSLYESELANMQSQAEMFGYELNDMLFEMYGMTLESYEEFLKESCSAQVLYEMVTDDIIAKEKLEIKDESKEAELVKLAEDYGTDVETLKTNMYEEILNESICTLLLKLFILDVLAMRLERMTPTLSEWCSNLLS